MTQSKNSNGRVDAAGPAEIADQGLDGAQGGLSFAGLTPDNTVKPEYQTQPAPTLRGDVFYGGYGHDRLDYSKQNKDD
ncbi:MAG: hypothetical protein AAGK00_07300 [Pseudomonadota bacterium]